MIDKNKRVEILMKDYIDTIDLDDSKLIEPAIESMNTKKEKAFYNKSNSRPKSKNKKKKIVAMFSCCIVVVLSLSILIPYLVNYRHLANYAYAAIARNRVINAQYLPNIDMIATDSSDNSLRLSNSNNVQTDYSLKRNNSEITLDNFNDIIDTMGVLDSAYNREFSVKDIKNEVYDVLTKVNVFNRWVYIKDEGYGVYYLDYSRDRISIVRISGFQPWVYDSKNDKIVWNEDFEGEYDEWNYPISLNQTYKIDYYYEDGIEVVECEIIDILDYYEESRVIQYQYLKNVKDTSFTKYVVTPIEPIRVGRYDSTWGYDIDSDNPLGTYRQFIQMDYTDSNNIKMMFVNQHLASAYNGKSDETSISFYNRINDEIMIYNTSFNKDKDKADINNDFNLINNDYEGFLNDFLIYGMKRNLTLISDPEMDYKNRNTKGINNLSRELRYVGSNDYFRIDGNSSNNNDNKAFFNLQQIPLYFNKSIEALALNTRMDADRIGDNVSKSPSFLDLQDETGSYQFENYVDNFLNDITLNITETSNLKHINRTYVMNNIHGNSIVISPPNNSAIMDYINLNDPNYSVNVDGSKVTVDVSASVKRSILLKPEQEYSLSLVLEGDNNNYVVLSNSETKKYNRSTLRFNTLLEYDLDDLMIDITDNYTLGIALTMRGDRDVICSNVEIIETNSKIDNIINYTNNGFQHTYSIVNDNNMIVARGSIKDKEPPVIISLVDMKELEFNVDANTTLSSMLRNFEAYDNDEIKDIIITYETGIYYDYSSPIVAGLNTITVIDRSGNETTLEFLVRITD